jgi:O-antigen/teichoic acid export membrane protein
MEKKGIAHKIIKNTFFNSLGRFWSIGISLVLSPYIVHRIGLERYGIWAILSIVTRYMGLFDLGIESSFVKYISENHAKKNYNKLNEVINTGFVFYLFFGAAIILIGYYFIDYFILIFKIPAALRHETYVVFLLCIFFFGLQNALSIFSTMQVSLQRMDISNKISILMSFVYIACILYFLKGGYGLIGLMTSNAVIIVLTSIVNVVVAYKILPELKINILFFTKWETLKDMFSFGFKLQLQKLSNLIMFQLDKFLIGYFLTVALVSYYHLGSAVVISVYTVCTILDTALAPALVEIEAKGERKRLIEAYIMTTKYVSFMIVPIFIFTMISANNIMCLWMGDKEFSYAATVIQILCVGFMINVISHVSSQVCIAINRPKHIALSSMIIVVANAAISLALIKLFGFPWVAIGTASGLIIGSLYIVTQVNKDLEVSFRSIFKVTVPFFLACAVGALPVFAMNMIIAAHKIVNPPRIYWFTIISIQGLIFIALYFFTARRANFITERDMTFFKEKARPFIPNAIAGRTEDAYGEI